MKSILLIGLGGAVGSVARFLIQVWVARYVIVTFPLGTFLVNISGCFAIGLLYGIAGRHAWLTPEWRLLLITGVCGGFTTFSSYSFEGMSLLREGAYLYFGLYVVLSVVLGLLATFCGLALMR
jgi:fluoride exporter